MSGVPHYRLTSEKVNPIHPFHAPENLSLPMRDVDIVQAMSGAYGQRVQPTVRPDPSGLLERRRDQEEGRSRRTMALMSASCSRDAGRSTACWP
jgi:hypothetical protein